MFKKLLLLGCLMCLSAGCKAAPAKQPEPVKRELWGDFPHRRPSCVKGIHLTAWYVGSPKGRKQFEKLLAETELNTVVIDLKETEGDVYVPGIKLGDRNVSVNAMPDIKSYLEFLKERGVFTIGRIVVFKDQTVVKHKPEWAIKSSSPLPKAVQQGYRKDVWVDSKGNGWADEYNPLVWKYNIDIAEKAVQMGFQGIQFDYIRFPSDGPTKLCVYSKPHNSKTAPKALADFLEEAHNRLKPYQVELSIDVFGLVGSYGNDMGIGQKLTELLQHVDVISPMMYPSHYAPGEYGLKDPNSAPYETVYRSIKDTLKTIKNSKVELRPYLQDFSLGVKYDAKHVRDQFDAAYDLGVSEWLLWNPSCKYTPGALAPDEHFVPAETNDSIKNPKK